MLVARPRELDDQDGVLGRKADQHDEADLREDVVLHLPREECQVGAKHGDRDAQEDAEGQGPALVERGQDQEDEEEGQAEYRGRGDPLLGPLLLVGHADVVEAHLPGHRLREDLLQGRRRLLGAVARRGRAIDLRAPVEVVPHGELGPEPVLHLDQRGEGHHGPVPVPHEVAAELVHAVPVLALRLDVDLPLAAEAVEVVDEDASHVALQGAVDVLQGHALLEGLVAVHVDVDLGDRRDERGRQSGQFLAPPRSLHELRDVCGKERDVPAGAVLEDKGEAAGGADARDRGWREGERPALRDLGELAVEVRLDGGVALLGPRALAPGLEVDEQETAVGVVHRGKERESDDGGVGPDAGGVLENLLDLADGLAGALERGGVGQLDAHVDVALVLLGEERLGELAADEKGGDGEGAQEDEAQRALLDQVPGDPHVSLLHPPEHPVETRVEPGEGAGVPTLGLQEHGAEGGAQRQGVERRDDDRDRDRERELLVEPAGYSRDEGCGYEHRSQDDRDRDHRPRHLLHGPEGRIPGGHALLDVVLDRLHDDDRVVDNQSYGEHQSEQRKGIHGEPEHGEEHEGADQ